MSGFSIRVKGIEGLEAALAKKGAKVDKAAQLIVRKGGALIEANSKKQFRARPVNTVRVSRNGKTWYAAGKTTPGQHYATGYGAPRPPRPTNRSGLLRDSIHTKAGRISTGRWQSRTGPSMKYAKVVELGGGNHRKFPYLSTGFAKSRQGLIEIYRKEWEKALA